MGWAGAKVVRSANADEKHGIAEYTYPPRWWADRCIGDSTVLLDDAVYLKGQEFAELVEVRAAIELSSELEESARRAYFDFYLADAQRPEELRTIHIHVKQILRKHVKDAILAVYSSLPEEITNKIAYLRDNMILDFILIKTLSSSEQSAIDEPEKFIDIARSTLVEAAFMRVAALWQEDDDTAKTAAVFMKEEAERKVAEALQRQKEEDIANADRDATEMQRLMTEDPEEYQRRIVEQRTIEADKRKAAKEEEERKLEEQKAAKEELEKKKKADIERFKQEEKEREAAEQRELNRLAEEDPEAYDRLNLEIQQRRQQKYDRKKAKVGDDDIASMNDIVRRKRLAKERRDKARKDLTHAPHLGLPK